MKFNTLALLRYWYFINERHNIYLLRRDGVPWPWTEDTILQTYKFTNIFRELDTGTIWLRENIREPYADHLDLFFNIAMYRLYNYVDTAQEILEKIGFITNIWQLSDVVDLMYERQKRGDRIFTGAHMITGTLGGTKIHQVFELCIGELWRNKGLLAPHPGYTLQMAFDLLNGNTPGYGPFISYEVVTDLRHTRYLEKASDIMTWANPGPGAKRGVCRLLGLKVNTAEGGKASREARGRYPDHLGYITLMRELLAMQGARKAKWVPKLELRDVEHSLCEWDKYERVLNGEGRPRSKYIPPHLRKFSK